MNSSAPTLRPYQVEAVDAAFEAWGARIERPALVLATGAGKTVIFSNLVQQFRSPRGLELDREYAPYGPRVLVLAHRDELIDQAIRKLKAELPFGTRVGKVKAGSNGIGADVVVASVQTLSREARLEALLRSQERYGAIGLVISDECHLAGSPRGLAAPSGWMKILSRFAGQGSRFLGVTATLARGDGKGLGDVWDKAVYKLGTRDLIDQGYLCDIEATQVAFDVDLSGVRTRGGDYVEADLGEALMAADIRRAVTDAYVEHAKDRRGLVFTPTVATAEEAARGLNEAGIRAEVVSGATPRPERQRIYRQFESGEVQVLANCQVLTTGFDAPWAEVAVLARPTKSAPLFQQMVGRVLRTHPGKDKALLLDLVGASDTHRLTPLIDLRRIVPKDPEEECFHTRCDACDKCDVCNPCTVCGTCEEEGQCAGCSECSVREDRRSCDSCGRCKQAAPGPAAIVFATETKKVNLFEDLEAESAYVWGRTPKGVPYLAIPDGFVFLWKTGEDRYDVAFAPNGGKWERTDHVGLPLDAAMRHGQAEVRRRGGGSLAKKLSGWRDTMASEKQKSYARRLGITADMMFMTKGEISRLIDAAGAAQVFDPHVKD